MILFFQIIFGLSVAGALFFIFKKIPVLLNYPRHPFEEISLKQKFFDRLKVIKDKTGQSDLFHESVMPIMEKFLRRFKVFILKLDNLLAKIVSRLRKRAKKREDEEDSPS